MCLRRQALCQHAGSSSRPAGVATGCTQNFARNGVHTLRAGTFACDSERHTEGTSGGVYHPITTDVLCAGGRADPLDTADAFAWSPTVSVALLRRHGLQSPPLPSCGGRPVLLRSVLRFAGPSMCLRGDSCCNRRDSRVQHTLSHHGARGCHFYRLAPLPGDDVR